MKSVLMTSSLLGMFIATTALAQHQLSTRVDEAPQAPFARQMTGHAFTATPPTSPSSFRLQTGGNFQAQPLNKERFDYMPSFVSRDPSFATMPYEAPGGLTNAGIGREMGRSWNDLYSPFNTGRQTWQPTKFTPPALPENRPHDQMWTPPIGSIGQRVTNSPSWIGIDISKNPIEPLQGFQTPIPQALDPSTNP